MLLNNSRKRKQSMQKRERFDVLYAIPLEREWGEGKWEGFVIIIILMFQVAWASPLKVYIYISHSKSCTQFSQSCDYWARVELTRGMQRKIFAQLMSGGMNERHFLLQVQLECYQHLHVAVYHCAELTMNPCR